MVACDDGWSGEAGAELCTLCPMNTYFSATGVAADAVDKVCKVCPDRKFSAQYGAKDSVVCTGLWCKDGLECGWSESKFNTSATSWYTRGRASIPMVSRGYWGQELVAGAAQVFGRARGPSSSFPGFVGWMVYQCVDDLTCLGTEEELTTGGEVIITQLKQNCSKSSRNINE